MLGVILCLLCTAALGLVDCKPHRASDSVGIHDDQAVCVSCCSADGLDKARFAAQKALLIGIEDGNKAHLWKVKSFSQKVYADEHIKFAEAQAADYLHTLDSVDIMVHVPALDADIAEIFGQILRHFLCQGRYKHSLLLFNAPVYLADEVVYLSFDGAHRYLGVEKWSFWKLFRYALDGIIEYTDAPLRAAAWVGGVLSAVMGIELIVLLILSIVGSVSSSVVLISVVLFLGGIILLAAGIIGESLAKTYDEVRQRPPYIVKHEYRD